jgi:hypothetical protein
MSDQHTQQANCIYSVFELVARKNIEENVRIK